MTALERRAIQHWEKCPKCSRVDFFMVAEANLCQYGRYHREMLHKAENDKARAQAERDKLTQGELGLKARRDPEREKRRAMRYATWATIIYFDGTPALQAIEDVKFSHDMEATWQTKP